MKFIINIIGKGKSKIQNIFFHPLRIFFFCFFVFFLSACGSSEETEGVENKKVSQKIEELEQVDEIPKTATNVMEKIVESRHMEDQELLEKTAELQLEGKLTENGGVIVEIFLNNPEKKSITSVRSFLAYDPNMLEGKKISIPQNSPFPLAAPGEQEFDEEKGIMRFGVSGQQTFTDERVKIGEVYFKRKKKGLIALDFYDPGNSGHSSVFIFSENKKPKNILKTPESPALLLPPL